jgi:hypothetical protein
MGLPVRQRRVLEHIEGSLQGSDPKLAAIYAMFARLNHGEEMPRGEQLRHSALVALIRIRLALTVLPSRFRIRIITGQPAILFFPLAIALTVVAIVFAARSSSGNSCTPARTIGAAHIAKPKACRTYSMNQMYVGRLRLPGAPVKAPWRPRRCQTRTAASSGRWQLGAELGVAAFPT